MNDDPCKSCGGAMARCEVDVITEVGYTEAWCRGVPARKCMECGEIDIADDIREEVCERAEMLAKLRPPPRPRDDAEFLKPGEIRFTWAD